MIASLATDRQRAARLVARLAIGGVFLWFGIDKLLHPQHWFGWIPPWFAMRLPVSVRLFIFANGILEICIAAALFIGRFVRFAAAAAGLFLTGIVLSLGANEITIRDVGLIGGALVVFLDASIQRGKPLQVRVLVAVCVAYLALVFGVGILYLMAAN